MWQYPGVPISPDVIRSRLLAALPDATIEVRDTTGGGDHFDVRVLSSMFAGRTLVARHQLVYAALGELMKKEIHALSLTTDVPESNQR